MQTKWLSLTILVIIIVMIWAALVQQPKKAAQTITTPQPALRTYTDPNNLFSVSVPTTWLIKPSTATETTGLHTPHPLTQAIQITQFVKPAEMGLTVQLISGQPTCPLQEKLTSTVAGLPASYNPVTATYTIPTQSETILVSVAYPGTHSFHYPPRFQPTPVSPDLAAQDKQLVFALLASLKFPSLRPFSCS